MTARELDLQDGQIAEHSAREEEKMGNPALDALRHNVTGAIERGEKEAIVGVPMSGTGTEWTEPGKGATRQELVRALPVDVDLPASFYQAVTWETAQTANTNLRLTGEPLTSEDIQRIATCEVK